MTKKINKITIEDMMKHPARKDEYSQHDKQQELECPICGWKGVEKDASVEYHDVLYDVSCPNCDKMLVVISYPLAN